MKRTLLPGLAIGLLVLIAAGCSPAQPDETQDNLSPGGYEYGDAPVESVELLTLESFPVQIHVVARGTFADGCGTVDQSTVERTGNTFHVRITARYATDQPCPAEAVPFEETIPLDVYGLPAGKYTVDVNGVIGTFTFEADNALPSPGPDTGDGQGGEIAYGLAYIESVSVQVSSTQPARVELTIRGYYPDGCTRFSGISDRLRGSTISVTVETQRPAGMMCTQAIVPFVLTYTLTSVPGRGTYIVDVNGMVAAQFTIP